MNRTILAVAAALFLAIPSVCAQTVPNLSSSANWTSVNLVATTSNFKVVASNGERLAVAYITNSSTGANNELYFAIQDEPNGLTFTKTRILTGVGDIRGFLAFNHIALQSWGISYVGGFLKTDNDGQSWTLIGGRPCNPFEDQKLFVFSLTVMSYYCTTGGADLAYTSNGGVTWATQGCNQGNGPRVYFVGSNSSFILARSTSGDTAMKHTRGTGPCNVQDVGYRWTVPGSPSAVNTVSGAIFYGTVGAISGTGNTAAEKRIFVVTGNTASPNSIEVLGAHDNVSFGTELYGASWDGSNGVVGWRHTTLGSMVSISTNALASWPANQSFSVNSIVGTFIGGPTEVAMASGSVGISTHGASNIWISSPIVGATVLNEPEEFANGLIPFIVSLGFVTPESQFFFAIILIGLTTVIMAVTLKFMAPGKLKLILVSVPAALVGAFCVLLSLYDLWMFFVASILAATIIQGTTEFRNTWREVRAAIAERVSGFRAKSGEGFEDQAAAEMSGRNVEVEEGEVDEPLEAEVVGSGGQEPEPEPDGPKPIDVEYRDIPSTSSTEPSSGPA